MKDLHSKNYSRSLAIGRISPVPVTPDRMNPSFLCQIPFRGRWLLYQLSRASTIQKTWTTEIHCLIVLEATSVLQFLMGLISFEASRRDDACFRLHSDSLLAISSIVWLVDASTHFLPLCLHGLLPVCLSLSPHSPILQGYQSHWIMAHFIHPA